jgi:acyl carrier protein
MNPVVRDPAEQGVGRRKSGTIAQDTEVQRDIEEYLGAHYSIDPDEITDNSTLEDLGLDSLGVLAIADIVENKYGISLDDERIAGVRTVSDFKDLVALKIAEAT